MKQGLLTIDVETWFSITDFSPYLNQQLSDIPLRLDGPINYLLDTFDQQKIKATFFWVGRWIKQNPQLVKETCRRGHELACHTLNHRLLYHLSPRELRKEIIEAKHLLEDTAGVEVLGFRAPSFSITRDSIPYLVEAGYKYDSSLLEGNPGLVKDIADANIREFAVSTRRFFGKKIPFGGGYLRLFKPGFYSSVFSSASKPIVLYLHPWEFDPHHPRVRNASFWIRFKHYNGLRRSESMLLSLLKRAKWGTCHSKL